ncbi:tRNA ligase [Saguinus oedipus]|uniref:tRNA ligase n=1 Tax=Saguinus oedipus TaxID=9490 RepID=A0ABQ9TW64_SAGOE|nr:tRNA ligase [Saguinus oedipus]
MALDATGCSIDRQGIRAVIPLFTPLSCSSRSFFHPKKEGKAKKPEKEASNSSRETEPPPKVALKEWNGVVSESDSPVKRPGRKAARVLGSEGEEEDEDLSPAKGQDRMMAQVRGD